MRGDSMNFKEEKSEMKQFKVMAEPTLTLCINEAKVPTQKHLN